MDKLVINDTHREDQDMKRPLQPLNETVTHQFMATDKHQHLFICLVRGSLHIDEVSHFFFYVNKTGAPYGELLGLMRLLSSHKVKCFFNSANLVSSKGYILRRGGEAFSSIRWIRCSYIAGLSR